MFVFKLQSVLDYRKHSEEKVLEAFAKIKQELEREKEKLQELIKERKDIIAQLRKFKNETVRAEEIARLVSYVEQLGQNEIKQKAVIDNVKLKLEEKRKELIEAVKKVKVMEKLKENQLKEYDAGQLALEQKTSDEMSALKFGRSEK